MYLYISTCTLDDTPSSKGRGSSFLKEEYLISVAIGLEKSLGYLEEYDLSLEFTLPEVFI